MCSGGNGKVRLWKEVDGNFQYRRSYKGHKRTVSSLVFDNERVFAGSKSSEIKIWDFKTTNILSTLKGHIDFVTSLDYKNNVLVSASMDKTTCMWDVEMNEKTQVFVNQKNWILTAKLNHYNVVTGGEGKVRLYDTRSGKNVRSFAIPYTVVAPWIMTLQFDDNKIVGGSFNKNVYIWDVGSSKLINKWTAHNDSVSSLYYKDDNIFTASVDSTVKVWDFHQQEEALKTEDKVLNQNNSCSIQ